MVFPLNQNIINYIDNNLTSDMRKGGALDLEKLAKKIGISRIVLAEFNDDKVSGLLQKENDQWNIYVNFTDSPKRRRFTIAHEIGHYISFQNDGLSREALERDGKVTDFAFTRNGEHSRMEAEANAIAATLLMPESDLRALIDNGKTIEEIAEYFQVSEIAVSVRMSSLGVTPFESYGWRTSTAD